MTGTFAILIIAASLFINYALAKVDNQAILWVSFGVILLVAAGCGALLVKFRKYGVGLFAAWGGVMLGFLVTTTFAIANVYAYYAVLIAAAIFMFFVAIKIEKTVVIILTAFIGSYALIRGISLYAGHYPSETELHNELESGVVTWKTMPKAYYAYLAGILILTIVSTIF